SGGWTSIKMTLVVRIYWNAWNHIATALEIAGTAIVCVEEAEIVVNAAYLSNWSEFFCAYFKSDMEEAKNCKFPVQDCASANFRELL
ncbi:hypothetical protein PFISCL1PPCAC_26012, partial [Pristionchus fissidentatus]